MHLSSLRSISGTLQNNQAVRVIHTYDDFLLSPEERSWLDRSLGKRLTWISNGGHLGNLYFVPVAHAILNAAGVEKSELPGSPE